MKQLLLLMAILLIGCQKDNLEPRPFEFGSISFDMSAPKLANSTAKVPSCKNIEPKEVRYSLTNSKGEPYTYTAPLELSGNNYVSTPSNTLPFGNYVINDVSLMNGNDTIYALPHQDELHLSPYWNTTLPMDITVAGTETVSGTVFCYNKSEEPNIDGILNGGFNPFRVQSLWFALYSSGCAVSVVIESNGFEYPVYFPKNEVLYEVAVPLDYDTLSIKVYNQFNEFVASKTFTSENPYNSDGVVTESDVIEFAYSCD